MKKYIAIAVITVIFMSLSAQVLNKSKLDELFRLIDIHDKGMGSVSIFAEGVEIYSNSIGFYDLKAGKKINNQTKFRIGSITKTFTAVTILQLVDEGKLTLDTKLSKFYPDLPNADEITIKHMLKHQSGLFNYTAHPTFLTEATKPRKNAELLKIIKDNPTVFAPGTAEDYSNSNYLLLTLIAERLDKKSYAKIIESRFIKPLKLKNTYYASKLNTKKNEAMSYFKITEWNVMPYTHVSWLSGAGWIVSTPHDVNVLYHHLFTENLVSAELLSEMLTIEHNFGMGIFPMPFPEKTVFGHTGGIDGYQAMACYFPEEEIAITYTSNGVDYPRNDIVLGVINILFEKDYDLPVFKETTALPAEVLEQYLGNYTSKQLPLALRVFIHNDTLMAQGTGQSAFPLEYAEEHTFIFQAGGIKLVFYPETKEMILFQGGMEFKFTAEM